MLYKIGDIMKLKDYINIILIILVINSGFMVLNYKINEKLINNYMKNIPIIDIYKIINEVNKNLTDDVKNGKISPEKALEKNNEILNKLEKNLKNSNKPIMIKQCFINGGNDITEDAKKLLENE
jgi:hypothetical protein